MVIHHIQKVVKLIDVSKSPGSAAVRHSPLPGDPAGGVAGSGLVIGMVIACEGSYSPAAMGWKVIPVDSVLGQVCFVPEILCGCGMRDRFPIQLINTISNSNN